MAAINGSKGFFQITSIRINGDGDNFPQVIAWGETVRVNVTIKNVSGKAVSKMYVIARGTYRRSDSPYYGTCAQEDTYLYGEKGYIMKPVSWANNASKTFQFDYTFSQGYYPADLTAYVMDVRMYIGIVTGTTFSDGSNNEHFYDAAKDDLAVLSERDNPRLAMFLERATNGQINDEGESLLADIRLTSDTGKIAEHNYTASLTCMPDAGSLAASVADMLAGITDSTTAITGTFNNGTTYSLTLTVSNGYESVTAMQDIPRAFANVHLSGATTGGVAFGKFSAATENNPLFECLYPARFYDSIDVDPNWVYPTVNSGVTTPGSYGNGRLRVGRIGRHVYVVGSVNAGGTNTVLCTLPESVPMPPDGAGVFAFAVCSGARVARIVLDGATRELKLEWVRNLSDGSAYTNSLWIDLRLDYWTE